MTTPNDNEVYLTTGADLSSIANAIRTKTGGSAQLLYPDDFITEIGTLSKPTGNINITNTNQVDVSNYATAQVVDANLIASNIRNDVTILGITGNLQPGVQPTGNINITTTNVTDVTNYATAQVVDSNLIASNIKNGVSILGISGSYSGGGNPSVINIVENNSYSNKIYTVYPITISVVTS